MGEIQESKSMLDLNDLLIVQIINICMTINHTNKDMRGDASKRFPKVIKKDILERMIMIKISERKAIRISKKDEIDKNIQEKEKQLIEKNKVIINYINIVDSIKTNPKTLYSYINKLHPSPSESCNM